MKYYNQINIIYARDMCVILIESILNYKCWQNKKTHDFCFTLISPQQQKNTRIKNAHINTIGYNKEKTYIS